MYLFYSFNDAKRVMRCCTETELGEDNHQHENKATCRPERTECRPDDAERDQQQMKIHSPEKTDKQQQHENVYQNLEPGEPQKAEDATPSDGATIKDHSMPAVVPFRKKILKWVLEILERN